MSADQIAVTVGAVALIVGIVWFFWMHKEEGVKAALTTGGYQEATVLVKAATRQARFGSRVERRCD